MLQQIARLEIPPVNIVIALCICGTIYFMMVKIDFSVIKSLDKNHKGLLLTINKACNYDWITFHRRIAVWFSSRNHDCATTHYLTYCRATDLTNLCYFHYHLCPRRGEFTVWFTLWPALATVVGVLVEVPSMLSLVAMINRTQHWFT